MTYYTQEKQGVHLQPQEERKIMKPKGGAVAPSRAHGRTSKYGSGQRKKRNARGLGKKAY